MDWIRDANLPTSLDVRDDRINLFWILQIRDKLLLCARACHWYFRMGPIGAEAMYNRSIHSYHGAGMIPVVRNACGFCARLTSFD